MAYEKYIYCRKHSEYVCINYNVGTTDKFLGRHHGCQLRCTDEQGVGFFPLLEESPNAAKEWREFK